MDYKELFIDKDDILLIRKELVRVLGDLNEAVILNQLHYWIEINRKAEKNFYDVRYWVFNTYQEWKETDFDFWSTDTIRRTLTRLENKGIILTANYNKLKIDKTKWYTIDYKKLQEKIDEYEEKQNAIKEKADCGNDMANCTYGNGSISKAIPENTSKNNNRDYIPKNTPNSFSKEKDLQSNSPKGEQSNSFSSEKKTAASNQTKRRSEKEMEDMVNQIPLRARQIAYEMTGDTDKATRVYECIDYFLGEYKEHSRERHKVLKDETLRKIVFKFIEGIEIERDGYTDAYDGLASTSEFVGDYRDVIDEYFNTDFKEKCDYSLVHFSGDTVLTNMMNHVCKEEWCESV